MAHTVHFQPAALKTIGKLERSDKKRIMSAVESLAADPRPRGAEKLSGYELWRIRVGQYRIIYEVDDRKLIVTVVRVGDRKEVYKNIQTK